MLGRCLVKIIIIFFVFNNLYSQITERGVRVKIKEKNEKRIALVIGNGAYEKGPLRNPVNDARDISNVLRKKKFVVTLLTDIDKRSMINAIRKFGRDIKEGGVGLFYYAGHGMQVNSLNYLIPIGADIEAEHEVPLESINVSRILGYMKNAENRMNIMILDACRDNPFARSFRSSTSGLAQMDSPTGTLIAYSTSPGKTAADGLGENGVYTKNLIKMIKESNLEIGLMFRKIRSEVRNETNGKQIPWESTSLEGSFYFSKKKEIKKKEPKKKKKEIIKKIDKESKFGFLQITAEPGAKVLIDGNDWGNVPPIKKIRLMEGKHEIIFIYQNNVKRFEIDIIANETITKYINFR